MAGQAEEGRQNTGLPGKEKGKRQKGSLSNYQMVELRKVGLSSKEKRRRRIKSPSQHTEDGVTKRQPAGR